MAVVLKDRVLCETTTTGTGTLTLGSAVVGYQSPSAIGDGNSGSFVIYAVDANNLPSGGGWECFSGTYTAAGGTLSRDSVSASSNGGAAVNFGAGTKRIAESLPASLLQYLGPTSSPTFAALTLTAPLTVANGGTGLASGTSGGVPYYSGSTTIASSAALGSTQVVLGGGAGAAPNTSANLTFDGTALVVTGNEKVSVYLRVGSTAAPTNITAGDITGTRLNLGNAAFDHASSATYISSTFTSTSGFAAANRITSTIAPASNATGTKMGLFINNSINAATTITQQEVRSLFINNDLQQDGAVTTLTAVQMQAITYAAGASATPGTVTTGNCLSIVPFQNSNAGSSSGTVTTLNGINFVSGTMTGLTCTTFRFLNIPNLNSGATSLGTFIGSDYAALTRGATLNCAIRVAAPSGATSNYALQLSDTGGTAAGGITFRTGVTTWYAPDSTTLRTDGKIAVAAGLSTSYVKVGGSLFDHHADAGNTTTTETDLYSDSIPASTLGTNDDKVSAEYGLSIVNSTSTKEVRVYFAGTAIFDSGALTISAASTMTIYVLLIRVSATVVRYVISANTTGASTGTYAAVGELTGLTLSGANTLKITGQAAGVGAATNDIVAKAATVEWKSAA